MRTLFDPACGTGGMLSVAEDHLRELNPGARLEVFGQELNAETYAICRSDMMLKGQDAVAHPLRQLASPRTATRAQRSTTCSPTRRSASSGRRSRTRSRTSTTKLGFDGRFGAGLPRINDGSFLFLQHMISKMKPRRARAARGSRSSSTARRCSPARPGSGESEIRRWIIENDWLEAIVALPDQLFYNTGISHLLLDRHQPQGPGAAGQGAACRRPRVLRRRCARASARSARRSATKQIAEITRLYGAFEEGEKVKIFPNEAFGFQRITVERPLRLRWEVTDETIAAVRGAPRRCRSSPDGR